MFAIVKNNQIVQTAASIKALFPNTSFPPSGPSAQFKADNSVMDIVDGPQNDQRFYWVTPANPALQLVKGVPTRLYVNTPKQLEDREEVNEDGNPLYVQVLDSTDPANPVMVDSDKRLVTKGLKSQWIAQVKATAGSMLSQTDWMVIRKAERGVEIPENVAQMRADIIAEADRLEMEIADCQNVEALIAVIGVQNWPKEN
jgi:hypothetical protein